MAPRRGKGQARGAASVPPPLHELESEVMEGIWPRGEVSVRTVMDALNKRRRKKRAYTTYMTVMARLHEKGVLERRREGKTDFYTPRLDREEFMAARARAQVEELVDQYGDVALSHFAEQVASLDPARRRALQRLARTS
jgi:predicted transcriptional regulator